jgi:DNA polymerase I-like protein with 3'-5' exonuclease and polymerase domains
MTMQVHDELYFDVLKKQSWANEKPSFTHRMKTAIKKRKCLLKLKLVKE